MERFTTLTAVAAPLPEPNMDTDKIIPARFLKITDRSGLGRHLFDGLRYRLAGTEIPEFILNRGPYRASRILVTHENFGCGSSREHAAWALLDFGIRCVVAPSFAEIFHANCVRNGILPVRLPRPICDILIDHISPGAPDPRLTVDLERCAVLRACGEAFAFALDPLDRAALLNGLDDIRRTLVHADDIGGFEAKDLRTRPWLPGLTGSHLWAI
jgi:3-isopropylmalate/(R)-2-methylmalate dehydratase small subunit